MVLSYLPAWTHDPNKARFFKFPEGVHRGTFETEIRKVVPAPLAFAKPVLEATIYGKRKLTDKNGTHEYGVKRVPLNSLAVKTDKGRPSLDLPLGKANLGTVVDPVIRKEVSDHITQNKDMLTLETWNAWCATYRRGGMNGPLVKKVLIKVAREPEANGYRDISKDGTGQLRRTRTGKGFASGGYFVIEISSPAKNGAIRKRYKIASVYSHTGKFKTQEQCLAPNDSEIAQNIRKKIQGFYQSGCIVEIKQPVKTLPAGKYSLNYMSGGKVAVTSPDGKQSLIAALTLFIAAGFRACTDS